MNTLTHTNEQTQRPTIVYVEDNHGDAVLLGEALRLSGFGPELLLFGQGDEALHYLKIRESARDIPPPHCILLDQYVPRVNGGQLLRFIRSEAAFDATPVYLFAPERGYADLVDARLVTKDCFLTKPTTWDGFLRLAQLMMKSTQVDGGTRPTGPESARPRGEDVAK
jgi:two-component system response regulator